MVPMIAIILIVNLVLWPFEGYYTTPEAAVKSKYKYAVIKKDMAQNELIVFAYSDKERTLITITMETKKIHGQTAYKAEKYSGFELDRSLHDPDKYDYMVMRVGDDYLIFGVVHDEADSIIKVNDFEPITTKLRISDDDYTFWYVKSLGITKEVDDMRYFNDYIQVYRNNTKLHRVGEKNDLS